MNDLTEAEQAAAEALAACENDAIRRAHGTRNGKHSDGTVCTWDGRAEAIDYETEARAVVAAVKYVIAEEELRLLARLLRREVETESCAEADDSGMKLAASFADDAADTCLRARQSLSRPTSEETRDDA